MARPRKNTVEYFPHICKSGKTISILEKKFGNDGYACWFKILEFLGDSEGHFFDCSDEYNWEYLKAKTLISEGERLIEIIDLLATVKAIDKDLWSQDKVLWSDNFLLGLAPVYQKRTTEMPPKPGLRNGKQLSEEFSWRKPHKGSKGKESIEKEKDIADSDESAAQFYITKKKKKLNGKRLESFLRFWETFDYKKGKAAAADAWLDIPQLTNTLVDQIVSAAKVEADNRIAIIEKGLTPKWAQGWITERRWEDETSQNIYENPCKLTPEQKAHMEKLKSGNL